MPWSAQTQSPESRRPPPSRSEAYKLDVGLVDASIWPFWAFNSHCYHDTRTSLGNLLRTYRNSYVLPQRHPPDIPPNPAPPRGSVETSEGETSGEDYRDGDYSDIDD